jgi:hypothetical protein
VGSRGAPDCHACSAPPLMRGHCFGCSAALAPLLCSGACGAAFGAAQLRARVPVVLSQPASTYLLALPSTYMYPLCMLVHTTHAVYLLVLPASGYLADPSRLHLPCAAGRVTRSGVAGHATGKPHHNASGLMHAGCKACTKQCHNAVHAADTLPQCSAHSTASAFAPQTSGAAT